MFPNIHIGSKKLSLPVQPKKLCVAKNLALRTKVSSQRSSHLIRRFKKIFKRSSRPGMRSASIVIPDKTRPLPNKKVVEAIVKFLQKENFKKIYLIIAYGNHKKHSSAKLKLTRSLLDSVILVHHSQTENRLLEAADPATSSRRKFKEFLDSEIQGPKRIHTNFITRSELKGVHRKFLKGSSKPIFLNKVFLESDLKIVLSEIKPHQIFGYSGASKMILPGLADSNTIVTNHLMRLHPASRLGNVRGNLPRQESEEIASRIPNVIYVNLISSGGKVLAWNVIDRIQDYKKIIKKCRRIYEAKLGRYDTVLTVGITPVNLNLYQLTKVITPAAMTVKKNGRIIVLADIKEKTFDHKTVNEKIYKLTIRRELPSGKEKVYLYSNLPSKIVKKTFMEPINSNELKEIFGEEKVLLIPDGDLIVPVKRT